MKYVLYIILIFRNNTQNCGCEKEVEFFFVFCKITDKILKKNDEKIWIIIFFFFTIQIFLFFYAIVALFYFANFVIYLATVCSQAEYSLVQEVEA